MSKGMRKRTASIRKPRKKGVARKKSPKPKGSEQQFEESDIAHLKKVPIPIGVNKIWYVYVNGEYTEEDIKKFTQIIELTLSE